MPGLPTLTKPNNSSPVRESGGLTRRKAVVVEGCTDAIAAHQMVLTNVVATGGTALTEEHLKTLARITSNVTLAFDGDHAGLQAVDRAADLDRAHHGIRLHVARLPAGRSRRPARKRRKTLA